MKRIFLSLLILTGLTMAEEPIEIEVITSRTHGLYYMIESMIDVPHRSPQMATNLTVRIGNWGPVAQSLKRWKDARRKVSHLRLPGDGGRSRTLEDALELVALQSENGQDMADRAEPWLGPEAGAALREVLEVVEPHYKQYWWPGQAFGGRKQELIDELERGDFQTRFAKAGRFYRGKLKGSEARVALIPYQAGIGDKIRTRGHNSGALQVMEVVLDRPNPGKAGVCFHEFLHGLWEGQEPEEAQRWREHFEAQGLVGRLAYVQLNEGLATALGNGWFHSKVEGKIDEGSWYHDPVIDRYAHALHPIVAPIAEAGRPPTDDELAAMVEAFKEALPGADSNFDVLAANFLTITNRQEAHEAEFQDGLMRLGPVRSSSVRDLDSSKTPNSTFVLYWLKEGEKVENWDTAGNFALRRTKRGWQMMFCGERDALFEKLKQLQASGLSV